ncbi:aspartyl/glutamyl-tRNA amidotransferase subunit B [Flammeovirgaceae bacterium 311]|nr:aspartyl/glutamyl-tRNA amidotransferase subunit B [Flammeovirgaceae bacterium 311]
MAEDIKSKYTVVIGLEVHAQLLTQSKMFASDAVTYGASPYGASPNQNISVITLAHPGTLPRINKRAVAYAIRMGIACHSQISRYNIFDRKNYFYPDLPKGYQLTQDRTPICKGGEVMIRTAEGERAIVLNRVHLEEDAGKSMHLAGETYTLVDFNRAGTPLIEIVTEPVLRSADEASAFMTEVRRLVRYLDICDGNMEEGSLRCDVNISLMPKGTTVYGRKVEVKNLNSFSNVRRAIEFEIARQAGLLEKGAPVVSETRTFDANTGTTAAMRTKEELNDYRYFPEPDLSPLVISEEWLQQIEADMPVLPRELYQRFTAEWGLSDYDAQVLTDNKGMALYYQEICQNTTNYKAAANWMSGPVKASMNELSLEIEHFPLTPAQIAALIRLVDDEVVSFSVASQRIFPLLLQNPALMPMAVAERENLVQESRQDALQPIIEAVIAANPAKVAEYRSGRKGIIGMFMGEVMKKSRGKADPKVASKLLQQALEQ